jgi:hypothetical protein
MAGDKLTIKLTADQQKQIKDATGKSITELGVDVASMEALSGQDLDKVSGGMEVTDPVTILHNQVKTIQR